VNNIILIGMPGAGKSTVGVILAKALKKTFIDTDIVIQEDSGRLVQDIVLNTTSMTNRSLKRGGGWSIEDMVCQHYLRKSRSDETGFSTSSIRTGPVRSWILKRGRFYPGILPMPLLPRDHSHTAIRQDRSRIPFEHQTHHILFSPHSLTL